MKIAIVVADDWIVLIKDGVEISHGHDIPLREALKSLGIECDYTRVEEDDDEDISTAIDKAVEAAQERTRP